MKSKKIGIGTALALTAITGFVSAHSGNDYYGHHAMMNQMYGYMGGGLINSILISIVLILLIILLFVLIQKQLQKK